MCGRPSTTIGFERRFNPLLQLSEPEFVELASQAPARPLNMTAILAAILAANRGEANFFWPHVVHDSTIPSVEAVEAVAWLRKHPARVLDGREPWEFAEGHIPGAQSVPQADLAVRLAEAPRDHDVLVVCAGGNRSMDAAGFLKAVGYNRVANLAGGTDGWKEAGNPVETGG